MPSAFKTLEILDLIQPFICLNLALLRIIERMLSNSLNHLVISKPALSFSYVTATVINYNYSPGVLQSIILSYVMPIWGLPLLRCPYYGSRLLS